MVPSNSTKYTFVSSSTIFSFIFSGIPWKFGSGRFNNLRSEDLSMSGGLKWTDAWQKWNIPSIMWRPGAGLGKGFGNINPLHPEGFNCPSCGRVYKLKSSLRNHQKWECGKEPQFQCPHCVYRAKQKMHIARHMERMHKEKLYKQQELV
ncbi:PREDICTED: zinc finger protein 768-like [Polistes dominula]|uniref:Zinc finger protein 768-like n=1 Tax=Polistes dominula TaxID=743375 RepID=A0ABM1IEH9_POLDO|nr:PREDICTED: zinc finger protein 768-like [Polistes dominula]